MEKRTFLMSNDGRGGDGEEFDLTPFVVETGSIEFQADKELTKFSPGSMTLKIADPEEKLWKWLERQVAQKDGALPPWIFYDVGEARRFFGIVPLSQCQRLRAERQPSIEARDWSIMLGSIILDWERPWPKAAKEAAPAETRVCPIDPRRIKRLLSDEWAMTEGFWMPAPNPWLQAGDSVMIRLVIGGESKIYKRYKVIATRNDNFAITSGFRHDVGGAYNRHAPHPNSIAVTKVGAWGGERIFCYTVARNVESRDDRPNYSMPLDSVDGLVSGDALELLGPDKKTFTVSQIDPRNRTVVCLEEVTLERGDGVYLSEESRAQLVFEDARTLIARAVSEHFSVDMGRFAPPQLPSPAFCWLPLKPLNSEDLMPISDIENTGGGLKVFSGDKCWEGNPYDGWETVAGSSRHAAWTHQRVTEPPSLMPYEVAPDAWGRDEAKEPGYGNRPPFDRALYEEAEAPQAQELAAWDAGQAHLPPSALYMPDYSSNSANFGSPLRRLVFNGASVTMQNWLGTAFGAATSATWPGAAPDAVCPCIGADGFVVGISSDTVTIAKIPGGASMSASLPPGTPPGRSLATTPWGVYVVTSASYHRIVPSISGGAITAIKIYSSTITNQKDACLLPNTFAGVDGDTVAVFGTFSEYAPYELETKVTQTHLLLLKAFPQEADPSTYGSLEEHPTVISADKAIDGKPITIGATRDPSALNRVVGHIGGAMFQIARQLPWTIERITPSDMSAMELIEHICQLHQAIAYPSTDGTLHIVSRNLCEKAIRLDIPRSIVSCDETMVWQEHASLVCVSGQGNDIAGESDRCVPGGTVLEMSGHPMIHTAITAKAVAEAMAQYFGEPRKVREMKLCWLDPSRPAPWQDLGPLPTIQINDETSAWMVYKIDHNEHSGECDMTLIESLPPAYGQDYGAGWD